MRAAKCQLQACIIVTTCWYVLPPIKAVCLDCPLDWCNENDPRCPYQLAKAAVGSCPRRLSVRERQVIAYLDAHPDTWFRVCDVIAALSIPRPTTVAVLLRFRREGRIEQTGKGRTLRLRVLAEGTPCTQ